MTFLNSLTLRSFLVLSCLSYGVCAMETRPEQQDPNAPSTLFTTPQEQRDPLEGFWKLRKELTPIIHELFLAKQGGNFSFIRGATKYLLKNLEEIDAQNYAFLRNSMLNILQDDKIRIKIVDFFNEEGKVTLKERQKNARPLSQDETQAIYGSPKNILVELLGGQKNLSYLEGALKYLARGVFKSNYHDVVKTLADFLNNAQVKDTLNQFIQEESPKVLGPLIQSYSPPANSITNQVKLNSLPPEESKQDTDAHRRPSRTTQACTR